MLCKVCNDHGRKGPRAAFKFDDTVGYHCFNCGAKASFDPGTHRSISENLEQILTAFGVPEDEINRLRFALLGNRPAGETKTKAVSHQPKEIPLPSHFYRITETDNLTLAQKQWIEVAEYYLEERGIDANSYPFMLATGKPGDLSKHPKDAQKAMLREAQKWVGRIIVPMYKDDNLIFYTGRDMTGKKTKKYESPSSPKNQVIFGFDKLFETSDTPLYIVEGVFDALSVDGVAVLGNDITEAQAHWLNLSNRHKVYVPDRFGSGHVGAEKAASYGWSISFPEIGDCKDLNEAMLKYGKLYVLATLAENTTRGLEARTRIKFYCHDKKSDSSTYSG